MKTYSVIKQGLIMGLDNVYFDTNRKNTLEGAILNVKDNFEEHETNISDAHSIAINISMQIQKSHTQYLHEEDIKKVNDIELIEKILKGET